MKIVLETNDADISEYYLQTLIQLYFPCETFGLSDNHGTLVAKIFKSGTLYNIYIKLSADGKCSEKYFENIETSDFPCGIEVSKSVVGKAFLNTA